MAQDNFIQDEILNLFNQQQQTQTQPVFNSGLLSGDQQNFGDVLANPDQAQVNAGIAGVASLLSGRDAGTALINSANAFGKTRQQTYTNQLAANKVEKESLKDRLSSAINIGNFQNSKGQLAISEAKEVRLEEEFGITSGLAQDKFDLETTSRKSVDILNPDGSFNSSAVQGPQGKLFKFDDNGVPQDVSAEIQKAGFRVAPSGRSQTNNINNINTAEQNNQKMFAADLIYKNELREKSVSGRNKISLAKRIKSLINETTITGVGVDQFTNLKSLLRSGFALAGANNLVEQLDNISSIETLRAFSGEAIKPYIEIQGRSFSDADRKATEKQIPGIANTPKGNIAIANIMYAGGLGDQDEFNFFEARLDEVQNNPNVKSTSGSTSAFNAYVNDLPRLNVIKDENGLETLNVVDDGRDLWKYYLNGRPKMFSMMNGTKITITELQQTAKENNKTFRELLGELDSYGLIAEVE